MGWEIPTIDDVLSEFTPSEMAAISNVMSFSGSGSGQLTGQKLTVILVRCIAEIRGYIRSGDYPLDDDPRRLPLETFPDVINICRWRFLVSAPSLKQLQTEDRKKAYDDSFAKLRMIASQDFAVEPPIEVDDSGTGTWNSENKLIMRTHPIPTPATQFTPQVNTYANPDAPGDREAT